MNGDLIEDGCALGKYSGTVLQCRDKTGSYIYEEWSGDWYRCAEV